MLYQENVYKSTTLQKPSKGSPNSKEKMLISIVICTIFYCRCPPPFQVAWIFKDAIIGNKSLWSCIYISIEWINIFQPFNPIFHNWESFVNLLIFKKWNTSLKNYYFILFISCCKYQKHIFIHSDNSTVTEEAT